MKAAPRLGRGLAALLGEIDPSSSGASAANTIPVDDLEPNPFQPRVAISDDDLTDLVVSIQQQGILQPILVRNHPHKHGRFQVIAGERRWRAAKLAGLSTIPSHVRDLSDKAAAAAALVENLQRRDLNAIEEAEGYRRLMDDFSLTQDDLAKSIGKSRSHVANLVRLLQLPDQVLRLVRQGALTAGHARAALACDDPQAAADAMIARGLSVRQAEALAASSGVAKPPRRKPTVPAEHTDADFRAVEDDLSEQLGLAVSIRFNGQGGAITLRYETLDQLDYILARLGRP